ncbi:TetR/AcrR family transcriptional regulator [Hazenella sp. IB182357]|uniref:TetR/AcrR family transcriptional regulator n=1 Tax=Polycladospora coralii TaxID=2771432 RepID=A0A926N6H1_9BACL|nr:TetR/AcrR family transcriptional regulator [Polycladospora coralii]MBD1372889.1 TetR/AcrR family transcriptional regulator [Polycladospora coralii]MBS7529417.1 TetR/AcrR family transcriptional regulator [Polycladospora coralii]
MAKRTGAKYDAIIEAAVKVIAEYGYHNTQVSKIAREAKVADGTIYLYFENKDDVLISLFSDKMGRFISQVEEALQQVESPIDKLYHLIRLHFENLERDHMLAIVTQIELRQSNPEVRKGIGKILKRYLNVIDQILIDGVKQNLFRSDMDIRITRRMIFGTLDETVTSWITKNHKYKLLEQVDDIHNLFIHGFGKP